MEKRHLPVQPSCLERAIHSPNNTFPRILLCLSKARIAILEKPARNDQDLWIWEGVPSRRMIPVVT